MIKPRSYQTECVQALWEYFKTQEGNPICALPTGTGKSVVIAMFLHSVFKQYPKQKVMVLTHVKELIEQNFNKLVYLWPSAPCGIYSAGLNRRDVIHRIIFAGVASVARRAHEFGHVDLVIVDECHLVSPTQETLYQKFFNSLKETNSYLKIIGFTATPWRLGQGKITEEGGIFTDTCFDITGIMPFNRLIAEKFIAPLIPKQTNTVLDLEGVHIRGGEYIPAELQSAVDKEHITRSAVMEALNYKESRKSWLVFAAGVGHAIHTTEILNEYGVSAVAVHSDLSVQERAEALEGLRTGKYQAAVNNNILTTGFDHPPIDLILCLRPTQSTVLWVQMLGRGTRPYDPDKAERKLAKAFPEPKSNCLVLDFAANTQRLGPINDPVIPRKKGTGGGDAPVKVCPVCKSYQHASIRFCKGILDDGTECKYEFKFETKLKQAASTSELIKGELPIVEVFAVDHINYSRHHKKDRPDSVKVTYYCGYRSFSEFVCIEHPPPAGNKAKGWVRQRAVTGFPLTVSGILENAADLKNSTHIRVWTNQKYPQILAHCFDGSEFGKYEKDHSPPPTVESPQLEYTDEDIPF